MYDVALEMERVSSHGKVAGSTPQLPQLQVSLSETLNPKLLMMSRFSSISMCC